MNICCVEIPAKHIKFQELKVKVRPKLPLCIICLKDDKAVEFLGKMLTLYTGRKNSGLPVVDRRRRINLPWDFNYSFLFSNLINFIVSPDAVVVTLPS
jgi:hypothetical protein